MCVVEETRETRTFLTSPPSGEDPQHFHGDAGTERGVRAQPLLFRGEYPGGKIPGFGIGDTGLGDDRLFCCCLSCCLPSCCWNSCCCCCICSHLAFSSSSLTALSASDFFIASISSISLFFSKMMRSTSAWCCCSARSNLRCSSSTCCRSASHSSSTSLSCFSQFARSSIVDKLLVLDASLWLSNSSYSVYENSSFSKEFRRVKIRDQVLPLILCSRARNFSSVESLSWS